MEKLNLVVFIDDDYATNFYHKVIVRDSGLVDNFLFFSEPQKALEYFEELAEAEAPVFPDAIFLDINMPKIDGWEFLKQYALIESKKSPVIIMLTTSLHPQDKKKALENPLVKGFNSKPLTEEHLKELIVSINNNAVLEDV